MPTPAGRVSALAAACRSGRGSRTRAGAFLPFSGRAGAAAFAAGFAAAFAGAFLAGAAFFAAGFFVSFLSAMSFVFLVVDDFHQVPDLQDHSADGRIVRADDFLSAAPEAQAPERRLLILGGADPASDLSDPDRFLLL